MLMVGFGLKPLQGLKKSQFQILLCIGQFILTRSMTRIHLYIYIGICFI